jgi:NADPH:quinone reductase
MRAVQITRFGGPDVLELVALPSPTLTEGQLLLDVDAAGVNFADTHQTEDTYLARQTLPLVPGAEVIGRTQDGRRVVALLAGGGYAEQAAAEPALCFDVPDSVTDGQALALVLQGTTAWHLLRTSAHLAPGETVVVHAGAGGVGSLAVQLAKAWGAGRIIATASSNEKRALAVELGADIAVDPDPEGLRSRLRDANGGAPVDVVLEMTGGPVFDESLRALAPFGRLVTFGGASGVPPTPVTSGQLMVSSRAVIGFWLAHCYGRPEMLHAAMDDLLGRVVDGSLTPVVGGVYSLADARRAHEDLLARRTTGKLMLETARTDNESPDQDPGAS